MESNQRSSNRILEVKKLLGEHGGTYACFSNEHPKPLFVWKGPNEDGGLPNGVAQSKERSKVILQWRRSLLMSDSGMYQCVHESNNRSSAALLSLEVVGKFYFIIRVFKALDPVHWKAFPVSIRHLDLVACGSGK